MIDLFKSIRQHTTIKWHYTLLEKNKMYRVWHWKPYHQYVHELVLSLVIISSISFLGTSFLAQASVSDDPTVATSTDSSDPAPEVVGTPESEPDVVAPEPDAGATTTEEVSPDETITEPVATSTPEATSTEETIATSTDDTTATTTEQGTGDIATTTDTVATSTASSTPEVASSTPEVTAPIVPPIIPPLVTDTRPTVVKSIYSPILKGTFHSGIIPIIVVFNKAVTVSGTPRLTLSTGKPATTAVDLKFAIGDRLYFLYHIVDGNSSSALDYSSATAIDLHGGSIKDSSGNNAIITLPVPGTSGSLSDKSKINIQTE